MENSSVKSVYITILLILMCSPLRALSGREADSLINKARDVIYTNPKQSGYFSRKALEHIPDECPSAEKTKALILNAIASKFMGDFDLSVKTLYDALDCCPPNDYGLLADINMQMANVYCRLRDYTKAFEINERATAISKANNDSSRLAASYNNRGIIHYSLNEFKTAELFFRNALEINRRLGDIKAIAANLNNMCLYEGDTDEKLSLIQEAIVINKNLNAIWALAENYNNMGKQYFFARRYQQALEALATARDAAEKSNAKELICDNYEYASLVYAAMKRYDKAYECLLQLYNLSLELQEDKKLRTVEQELLEKRVLALQTETELKEQAYSIEILKLNIFILIAVLVLLGVIAIFVPHWIRKRKDLQLAEARYKLEQSEREVAELKIRQQEQVLSSVQNELAATRQEVTTFAMFLRSRNELLEKIRGQVKEGYKMNEAEIQPHLKKVNAFIKQHQSGNDEMNTILMNIEEKNTDFLKRLLVKHPNLTQGEKYLATLLRINLSTKEIALLTGSIPKTINMGRYRLRKSLGLQADEEITDYLQRI